MKILSSRNAKAVERLLNALCGHRVLECSVLFDHDAALGSHVKLPFAHRAQCGQSVWIAGADERPDGLDLDCSVRVRELIHDPGVHRPGRRIEQRSRETE